MKTCAWRPVSYPTLYHPPCQRLGWNLSPGGNRLTCQRLPVRLGDLPGLFRRCRSCAACSSGVFAGIATHSSPTVPAQSINGPSDSSSSHLPRVSRLGRKTGPYHSYQLRTFRRRYLLTPPGTHIQTAEPPGCDLPVSVTWNQRFMPLPPAGLMSVNLAMPSSRMHVPLPSAASSIDVRPHSPKTRTAYSPIDLAGRVHQTVCQFTVGGKQHQAGRVDVPAGQ